MDRNVDLDARANEYLAVWARKLPSELYRTEMHKEFSIHHVGRVTFPQGSSPVHIKLLSITDGDFSVLTFDVRPLQIVWGSLPYLFGIQSPGTGTIIIGVVLAETKVSGAVNTTGPSGLSRKEVIRLEYEGSGVGIYSNYFKEEIQKLLSANSTHSFSSAEDRVNAYYSGDVSWPWLYPKEDTNLVLEFSKDGPKNSGNEYERLFPSAEAEMQRFNINGERLGAVSASLAPGKHLLIPPARSPMVRPNDSSGSI